MFDKKYILEINFIFENYLCLKKHYYYSFIKYPI